MSISLLQHTQSISGFIHKNFEYIGQTIVQNLRWKTKRKTCPICKSNNTKAKVVHQRKIKGLNYGSKEFFISFDHHRIRCGDCKAHVMEKLDFIPTPKSRITKLVARSIIEFRQHMTIKAVAAYFNVHWELVKDLEKTYLTKKFKRIKLKMLRTLELTRSKLEIRLV